MLPWDCMDFNRKVAIFVHLPDCFPVGFFHNPSGHWRIWRASKGRNTELMGSTFHLPASLSINWSIVTSWSKELKWSESIQLGLLTVFPWPDWTLHYVKLQGKFWCSSEPWKYELVVTFPLWLHTIPAQPTQQYWRRRTRCIFHPTPLLPHPESIDDGLDFVVQAHWMLKGAPDEVGLIEPPLWLSLLPC